MPLQFIDLLYKCQTKEMTLSKSNINIYIQIILIRPSYYTKTI